LAVFDKHKRGYAQKRARTFKPMSEEQKMALLDRTKEAAAQAVTSFSRLPPLLMAPRIILRGWLAGDLLRRWYAQIATNFPSKELINLSMPGHGRTAI
jgi:hypothetical protein